MSFNYLGFMSYPSQQFFFYSLSPRNSNKTIMDMFSWEYPLKKSINNRDDIFTLKYLGRNFFPGICLDKLLHLCS